MFEEDFLVIRTGDIMKTSNKKFRIGEIKFRRYQENDKNCIFTCIKEYLKLTVNLRSNITHLFITTTKHYKIASQDTLARWIKATLQSAGIDMSIFTPHSTRSASASWAATRISQTLYRKQGVGGAWEHLLNITIKILFSKKTLQIVFWSRFVLTFYLTDKTLLLLSEFVLQMKFISFQFSISLSCSLPLNISANFSESGNENGI